MAKSRAEQVRTVLYMFLIAAFFTALVAGVNAMVREGIRANEELREIKGVLDAAGIRYPADADPAAVIALAQRRLRQQMQGDIKYFESLSEAGDLTGYVIPVGGAGFWGPVNGYLALDTGLATVTELVFVSHTETPGLGAKISEAWFCDQFRGRSATEPIRLIAEGRSKGPNDVDAITGATGTCQAVESFVNLEIQRFRDFMSRSRGAGN